MPPLDSYLKSEKAGFKGTLGIAGSVLSLVVGALTGALLTYGKGLPGEKGLGGDKSIQESQAAQESIDEGKARHQDNASAKAYSDSLTG